MLKSLFVGLKYRKWWSER